MGEGRKTLKIWFKRKRDRGVVEGSDQGHKKYPRPKTALSAQVFCKKKKNSNNTVFKIFFTRFKKKGLLNFFSSDLKKQNQKISKKQIFLQKTINKILRIPKLLLSSSRGRQFSRT